MQYDLYCTNVQEQQVLRYFLRFASCPSTVIGRVMHGPATSGKKNHVCMPCIACALDWSGRAPLWMESGCDPENLHDVHHPGLLVFGTLQFYTDDGPPGCSGFIKNKVASMCFVRPPPTAGHPLRRSVRASQQAGLSRDWVVAETSGGNRRRCRPSSCTIQVACVAQRPEAQGKPAPSFTSRSGQTRRRPLIDGEGRRKDVLRRGAAGET
jgi:hypothetical protein